MIKCDMHIHTTVSDGAITPLEIIEYIKQTDLDVVSITDHNAISGSQLLMSMANEIGKKCVSGIELTCIFENRELHILGYNYDYDKLIQSNIISKIEQKKSDRILALVAHYQNSGLNMDRIDVNSLSKMGYKNARSKLASMVVSSSLISPRNVMYTSFSDLRTHDYIHYVSAREVIDAINYAGGVAVLAHPFRYAICEEKLLKYIKEMREYGLIGLERYYHMHREYQINWLGNVANELDMICTGGSDCHKHASELCSANAILDEKTIQKLGL